MKYKLLAVLLIMCFLAGCGYSNYMLSDDSSKIESIIVKIVSTGEDENGNVLKKEAIGFRVKDGLVVGLTHATTAPFQTCVMTPFGVMCRPVETTNRKYFIDDTELQPIGSHRDISLFAGLKPLNDYIPFGDSDKLVRGTKIATLGFSRAQAFNFKTGVVSYPNINGEYDAMLGEKMAEELNGMSMMIAMPVNPGDSGSPVIAFYNGNPQIVGIVCAVGLGSQGMNFAFHSNFVQEAIQKITRGPCWYLGSME